MERKTEETKKIYTDFIQKIEELKKEQDVILKKFLDRLEKTKIEKIRNELRK